MVTSVHRRIEDPHLEFLPRSSLAGGMDLRHHWNDKVFYLDAKALFSDIRGSEQSILALQETSARYYQRPDAKHLTLDPTRTKLQGHAGVIEVGKGSRGRWRFAETLSWRSPGFELNDLGYLRIADVLSQSTTVAFVETEPVGIFREYTISGKQENTWDFGGEFLLPIVSASASGMFANKWTAAFSLSRFGRTLDTRLLRGGPAVNLKGFWSTEYQMQTDRSRKVSAGFSYLSHLFDDGESRLDVLKPAFRFRPTDPLLLTTELEYTLNKDIFQYVSRVMSGDEPRDLVAEIDQSTFGLTFRIDYAISPELTIQYYGNPYASVGTYYRFKRFTNPRANSYSDLYHTFSGDEIQYDPENNRYHFDENGDGNIDYSIDNPDFNFREFRSNLVCRWEYKPGSVLYVVWTQGRSAYESITNSSLRYNFSGLFSTPAENIFLVKLRYWLPL
jgi:hypothetical protein